MQAIYALVFAAVLLIMRQAGGPDTDAAGCSSRAPWCSRVASVLAATSQTAGMLIGGRALQGLGGAMMSPASLSLVNAMYRGDRRPRRSRSTGR